MIITRSSPLSPRSQGLSPLTSPYHSLQINTLSPQTVFQSARLLFTIYALQLKKSEFYEIKEYQFSQCTCLFLHILRYKNKMHCIAVIRPRETDGLALEWVSVGLKLLILTGLMMMMTDDTVLIPVMMQCGGEKCWDLAGLQVTREKQE